MAKEKNYALVFIYITILIDIIGIGIVAPVLPTLILKLSKGDLSATTQYIGWFISIYAFIQFIFAPILGSLSDRYGRRPLLLWSLLGLGIDYIILAMAPNLIWLFVGRIIAGVMGSSITTATAYVADVSTPEKKESEFWNDKCCCGAGLNYWSCNWRCIGTIWGKDSFLCCSRIEYYQFYVWRFCFT
ncbi:MFS transporter [Chryseobacterium capnotolerans]|uniref:MFS transporter n=1 Tax=Chryseobacterium capnotolerans TaxID=2759528 RepID=UPI0032119D45